MVTKARVSLEEYLALPQTKPYLELLDGEVVEKSMPGLAHSTLVARLIFELTLHLDQTREGRVETELRHLSRTDEWTFLPDISVTLADHIHAAPGGSEGPVETMPDFAIEVLSPDDQPGRVTRRIAHYMRAGVRLLWVIDPETEQVTVWEPGDVPRVIGGSEELSAAPVLPAFSVDLGSLFARLRRP